MQWIYSLCLEMVQYIANSLLTVFSMDLDYFFQVAPVAKDILSILIAAGWALLMGNLVFQAVRSMVSGLGFEGEDPKLLFTRTFVFAFLLLASQQICEIGLNISAQIIQMLQIPSSVIRVYRRRKVYHPAIYRETGAGTGAQGHLHCPGKRS